MDKISQDKFNELVSIFNTDQMRLLTILALLMLIIRGEAIDDDVAEFKRLAEQL